MTHYIDKDALVAEINKRLKANGAFDEVGDDAYVEDKGMCEAYRSILSFINTLEVKDVNLEKALSDLDKDIKEFITTEEFERESETQGHYWIIAKHAFLLGLNYKINNN